MFLSKFLQGIECDLLEATKEGKTVIELLRAERLDESVWDELYQSALDLSEPFDIVYAEAMWKTDYQSQSPCRHAKTVLESFFVLCVYRPHEMELESRLIKSENRFYAQYLLPRVIGNITNEQIATRLT